jgi:hypothetical protein
MYFQLKVMENNEVHDLWPVYTEYFISSSGIYDLCGTVARMVTPKGSMSTEGEALQFSVF